MAAPPVADVEHYLETLGLMTPLTAAQRAEGACPDGICHRQEESVGVILQRVGMVWAGGRWCQFCPSHRRINWIIPRAAPDPQIRPLYHAARVAMDLRGYERAGVRWVPLELRWEWTNAADVRVAHATLLVFDTKRHTYNLFDPNEGTMTLRGAGPQTLFDRHLVVVAAAALHGPLVPGYHAEAVRRQAVPSLQTHLERTAAQQPDAPLQAQITFSGLCALLTTLVVVACRRFNYYDLWTMAGVLRGILQRRLTNRTLREMFRFRLFRWYRGIVLAPRWDRLEQHLGLRVDANVGGRCAVQSERTGTFCRRRPCAGHAYCPQHRHLLLASLWRRTRRACKDAVPWDQRLGPNLPAPAHTTV